MLKKGTPEYRDHIVKLAAIAAAMAGDPEFDPRDLDDDEWHNAKNCLSILAEAFALLVDETKFKPRFRVKAGADRKAA